jgi:hypothetical protein
MKKIGFVSALLAAILALASCPSPGGGESGNGENGGGGLTSRNAFICYDEDGNEYTLAFPGSGVRTVFGT